MDINKIYFCTLSHITIHRIVSVASATNIRVWHKNTNKIHINSKNVWLKPPDITVNTLSTPYGQQMSNDAIVKHRQN